MRQFLRDILSMSAAGVARRLVAGEQASRGVKLREARAIVAKEAGISPGSLENLGRGRLKYVDRITSKLNALLAKKIEQQICSLERELGLLRATESASEIDLARAEAALEEARRALGK